MGNLNKLLRTNWLRAYPDAEAIQPQGGRVFVEAPVEDGMTSAAGVHLVHGDGSVAELNNAVYGTVLAVGPGPMSEMGVRIPLDIQVGSTVCFEMAAAFEVACSRRGCFMIPFTAIYFGIDPASPFTPEVAYGRDIQTHNEQALERAGGPKLLRANGRHLEELG